MAWDDARARHALRTMFDVAIAAADPRSVLSAHLPDKPGGRCIVVGAGKSAALMAAALEDAWPDVPLEGTVVTRYGHAVPTRRIEVIESSHPVPDANSERGARRLLEQVRGLRADDLVVALISGGASALCAAPAQGLTLADKQAVNRALLACGANISEMNCVRKHLSAIKGGRLAAAAAPARVLTLAISDVPGDDPAVIGSGPTVPDPTTFAAARTILTRYQIEPSPAVAARLAQVDDETPKPGSLPDAEFRLIAAPMLALRHAARTARDLGLTPVILGDALEGEAREMGTRHGRHRPQCPRPWRTRRRPGRSAVGRRDHRHHRRAAPPAMAAATRSSCSGSRWRLAGAPGIWAVAGDTDGIDGMDDVAGALLAPDTLARVRAKGLDPRAMLTGHDSHSLFDAAGDLIRTGPTLTNVNDFRAILIAEWE